MGRDQYPLDERIHACERELIQLSGDAAHLGASTKSSAHAMAGELTQSGGAPMLHGVQRSILVRVNGFAAQYKDHLRRVVAFRRVLGTLDDDCKGHMYAPSILYLIGEANKLRDKGAASLKEIEGETRGLEEVFSGMQRMRSANGC